MSRPQPEQGASLPGFSKLLDSPAPIGIYLLSGPAGAGKTMYCRQFLLEAASNTRSIFVSPGLSPAQFDRLFSSEKAATQVRLLNPYYDIQSNFPSENQLKDSLSKTAQQLSSMLESSSGTEIRLVLDSLTQFRLLYGEGLALWFATNLLVTLRKLHASAIFTISASEKQLFDSISSLVDGVIEMKLEEGDKSLVRSIRLLSVKGLGHKSTWVTFDIADNGSIQFQDDSSVENLTCNLCGKVVHEPRISEGDLVFDSPQCVETYKRLVAMYGADISEIGLPAGVANIGFFFIDIVGLSDPSLSVSKQISKIEALNKLIDSCEAYRKTPRDKKIVLPTGDGMAVGFLIDPELPLRLAIQLHKRLRTYNQGRSSTEKLAVRIGIASGPVFVVKDINDNSNVWGPGIILARRVMDAGDAGHILVADKAAQELISIKDEYSSCLELVERNFEIKHGQLIRVYSAYSPEFGNAERPGKLQGVKS